MRIRILREEIYEIPQDAWDHATTPAEALEWLQAKLYRDRSCPSDWQPETQVLSFDVIEMVKAVAA